MRNNIKILTITSLLTLSTLPSQLLAQETLLAIDSSKSQAEDEIAAAMLALEAAEFSLNLEPTQKTQTEKITPENTTKQNNKTTPKTNTPRISKTQINVKNILANPENSPSVPTNTNPNTDTLLIAANSPQKTTPQVSPHTTPKSIPQTEKIPTTPKPETITANNLPPVNLTPQQLPSTQSKTIINTLPDNPPTHIYDQIASLQYIIANYKINNIDLNRAKTHPNKFAIHDLYQYAFKQQKVYQKNIPAIGDIAFFHNTIDNNRDGRWNDWYTLVGIVENIDKDATISILAYIDNKVQRFYLNLKNPELLTIKNKTINTQLRKSDPGQSGSAAKLFAGFANLLGDAKKVIVIDNWNPLMNLNN